ncbi:hypothetical protein B0H10DRAFT_2028648 [Mycena sp. CBHHK59/15]|nr:hypothetical protein B0H10DRAFT_2028648 [Mycena sp. CBHHK59/15]
MEVDGRSEEVEVAREERELMWFGKACRFAALVQRLRAPGAAHTLEAACAGENAVRAWLASEFGEEGVDAAGSANGGSNPNGGTNAISNSNANGANTNATQLPTDADAETQHWLALTLAAERVVLRLYMPWLGQRGPGGSAYAGAYGATHAQQAVYGSVAASHAVVRLGAQLAGQTTDTLRPATPDTLRFYPLARALFDAGVVLGHAAVRHPGAVFAGGAREGLEGALALLRGDSWVMGSGGGVNSGSGSTMNGVNGHPLNSSSTLDNANKHGPLAWDGRETAVGVLEALVRRMHGSPTLKRKHDAIGGEVIRLDPPAPAPAPAPRTKFEPLGDAPREQREWERESEMQREREMQREQEMQRAKEKEKEKEKEKKKRPAAYPSVGIRVRPGREGPLALGAKKGSPLRTQTREEMGYYPQQQQPPPPQQQQQPQQQQVPMVSADARAYRSRSSSISQDPRAAMAQDSRASMTQDPRVSIAQDPRSASLAQDPRMQPPPPKDHIVAMEYTLPFSDAAPGMDYARARSSRPFHDAPGPFHDVPAPAPGPPPQAGYAGDSASAAMYDLQPPRAGSYDADAAYGSVGSPYGSGPLSTASSPYTTTSGGLSTPTFGNGSGTGAAQDPSPPTYATVSTSNPQFPGHTPYYASGGGGGVYEPQYDAGQHVPLGMDAAVPVYEKVHHQQMYEVKQPHMEHAHAHYHLEPDQREMGHAHMWPPPQDVAVAESTTQYWASPDEYKFYPQ